MERKSSLMKSIVQEEEHKKKQEKKLKTEQAQQEKQRVAEAKAAAKSEVQKVKEATKIIEPVEEVVKENKERASPGFVHIFFKFLGKIIISIFNLIITLIENIWWIFAIIIISAALTIIFNSAGVDINVLIERGKSLLGL